MRILPPSLSFSDEVDDMEIYQNLAGVLLPGTDGISLDLEEEDFVTTVRDTQPSTARQSIGSLSQTMMSSPPPAPGFELFPDLATLFGSETDGPVLDDGADTLHSELGGLVLPVNVHSESEASAMPASQRKPSKRGASTAKESSRSKKRRLHVTPARVNTLEPGSQTSSSSPILLTHPIFEISETQTFSPVEEINHHIDQENDMSTMASPSANDIDVNSYEVLLEEALLHWGNKKPDFCVRDEGQDTKLVKLPWLGTFCRITFVPWDANVNSKLGFWVFKDDSDRKFILKQIKKEYRVWNGVEAGFMDKPPGFGTVTQPTPQQKSEEDFIQIISYTDEPRTRTLRRRTSRQIHPYQAVKMDRKTQDKGRNASNAEIDELATSTQLKRKRGDGEEAGGDSNLSAPTSEMASTTMMEGPGSAVLVRTEPTRANVRSSEPVTVRYSFVPTPTVSTMELPTPSRSIFGNTSFRTWFDEIDEANVPVYLKEEMDAATLVQEIEKKWKFVLGNRNVTYCTIRFPWLGEGSTMILHKDNQDAYSKMVDEISRAPGWSDGRCEVDITIHANG